MTNLTYFHHKVHKIKTKVGIFTFILVKPPIMTTKFKLIIIFFLVVFGFQSCQDNDDIGAPAYLEVNDFIWKGLNLY